MADQVLYSGVACITDLMVKEGLINLDFADVRAVMRGMGKAMMGTGEASGEKRAVQAAEAAIANPLLDETRCAAPGPADLDHGRQRPDAVRGRRGGYPNPRRGRSRRQHHPRRHLRRLARRHHPRVGRRHRHRPVGGHGRAHRRSGHLRAVRAASHPQRARAHRADPDRAGADRLRSAVGRGGCCPARSGTGSGSAACSGRCRGCRRRAHPAFRAPSGGLPGRGAAGP